MSIFGDLETPAAKKPAAAAKQLVELSIKPHVQMQADDRGKILVPTLQALLDPPTQTVTVRAEAKTAFSDGTAGDGIQVTFFLNGKRVCDVPTDDFGIALLEHPIPANLFTMNWQVDELTARVRGFSKEASVKVKVLRKQIKWSASHRWKRVDPRVDSNGYHQPRYDDLELSICVERKDPPGFAFPIQGIVVVVERYLADVGQYETLASGTLDSAGNGMINLPNYCFDRLFAVQHSPQRHPLELSWSQSRSSSDGIHHAGVRIRLKDWPHEDARFVDHGRLHEPNYDPRHRQF